MTKKKKDLFLYYSAFEQWSTQGEPPKLMFTAPNMDDNEEKILKKDKVNLQYLVKH